MWELIQEAFGITIGIGLGLIVWVFIIGKIYGWIND